MFKVNNRNTRTKCEQVNADWVRILFFVKAVGKTTFNTFGINPDFKLINYVIYHTVLSIHFFSICHFVTMIGNQKNKKSCHFEKTVELLRMLKELRNRILRIICLWSSFCSIRVYTGMQFPPILLRNYSFRVSFGSLSILYFEFWCHLYKTS